MSYGHFIVPSPYNETVKSYSPGSAERKEVVEVLKVFKNNPSDIPNYIGNQHIRTGNQQNIFSPHQRDLKLGFYHKADVSLVQKAIQSALMAKKEWENMPWEHRASIFLKAAELLAGPYRAKINAATMLGQSKNVYQAEIDAACEFIDFLRFNVKFMTDIYSAQPVSAPGIWNRVEVRPLEGFVYALTPFNFTSIAGNLPSSAALMGNTVVWKASETQIYSAAVIMEVFKEAGLPDGVINLVHSDGIETGKVVFANPDFAGIHFTGSTGVFQQIWTAIGQNISKYKSYPKIVGETGGKDFVLAHSSADVTALSTALSRGAFEFQGQKCSAASRAYLPKSLWPEVKDRVVADLKSFKMGSPEDFGNFINAVIDQKAFDKISNYIEMAKKAGGEVIVGGNYSDKEGFFIEPTVILTSDPKSITMVEEIFGPVLTIYLYNDNDFQKAIDLVDTTSPYALTGAIFAQDRYAIDLACKGLRNAAGNFYINDKPTGAVVGQQPFGGGRASGTNDKAGSALNLTRWTSPRTIKETFVPAKDYRYPFLS